MFTLQLDHSCANLILEFQVFALIKRIMTVIKKLLAEVFHVFAALGGG